MSIKTGRYGKVLWDPAGGPASAAVQIISLNKWKLNEETAMEDVSCFGDLNRVYVPGLKDLKGDVAGFWNSSELTLWKAADSGAPGTLVLMPNAQENTFLFSGLAYLNASIDCSLQAPKVSGTWAAAASWATPGQVLATGATAGIPGAFTPAGASAPGTLQGMTGVTASPTTAWTAGQYVSTGDASQCHWNGTAWVVGVAP